MAVMLVDKGAGENGLRLLEASSAEHSVVLIQDGVYLDVSRLLDRGVPVYAVERDVDLRGLSGEMDSRIKAIDYGELVDLIVENKVLNFA